MVVDLKIKRTVGRCLLFFLMMGFVATAAAATTPAVALVSSFSDIPLNTVHSGALEYLKSKNVISGYQDGTFKPDQTINRAEALKMVMLAIGEDLTSQATITFPDVHESDWFYTYIRKATEIKIVEGYQDGKFKPENNINLAESLKIIFLAFKVTLPTSITDNPFADVDKALWYAPYADYGKVKQLVWVLDDGKFHADRDITRADFAEIIYRMMYIKELNLATFPLSTNWPTYTHPTDHYSLKYPFGWTKIDAGKQIIFWKQDKGNNQISFARVYPNSATVVAAVDPNEAKLSLDDYLAKIIYDQSAVKQKVTLNGYPFISVAVASTGLNDFYFELPNNYILVIYSQLGDGLAKGQLAEEIRYLVGSVRYNEAVSPDLSNKETFLSNVRKNILVKGQGESSLNLFKDLVIIETDSIGIGTGPIDYYYSKEYDVSLKYERNSKTLLALADGKSSSF